MPRDTVRYRCDSDVLGYAILLLVSLFAFVTSIMLRTLLGRLVWGRELRFEGMGFEDVEVDEERGRDVKIEIEEKEGGDGRIGELEGEVEGLKKSCDREIENEKNRYETEIEAQKKRHEDEIAAQKTHHKNELKEQKYHYMTKLMDSETQLNTITLTAAADLAAKDQEMKTLSNNCRQALDPHYQYPESITIAMIASWEVRRAENIEKKFRKRERALADGSLATELEETKKAAKDDRHDLEQQIVDRDDRIEELEEEVRKKTSLVKSLDEQHDILMEMNMDSSEMLSRTRRELSEQKTVREELEKVVVLKNERLEAAGDKLWAMGVQLHEATVEIAILKANITAASEKYATLEHHNRAAEMQVERLREKVHDVTRGYRRLSKELDKLPGPNHHHWSNGKQAAWLRAQLDLESGAREGQEPEEEESSWNHVEELAAAGAREGELAGRIGALEAEIVVLKQQSTTESNAVSKHTQIESTQPQSPYSHDGDLAAAAVREGELAGRIEKLESENAVLKKQSTTKPKAVSKHTQTEPTQPQPPCIHEGALAAAAVREGELAGRIDNLESENAVLKKQSTAKSTAVSKHTQTKPAKPQPSCNHDKDLAAATAKEGELTSRIRAVDLENAALKTQLAAKSNALQTILEQAEALRTQMATELHAKDIEKVTINECIDQYRNLADEAKQCAQNQETELNELRVEHNTAKELLKAVREGREAVLKTLKKKEAEIAKFQKDVADDKAEIYRQQCLVTSKEAECVKLREETEIDIGEINRQISLVAKKEEQRLATKAQVTAKIGAELHLAAYLSRQNFRLPIIAAVESDVLSAKAIAEERAATPYNAYAMKILAELAKLNKDIDKLRSTLQDPEAQPTRQDLRDFLKSGEIDVVADKLKQAAPRLWKQVVQANKLASALGDLVNVEVAKFSREEIESLEEELLPEEQDEIEVGVVDDEATDSLRGEMLIRLMKPRDEEPQLADEAMAYPQRMA